MKKTKRRKRGCMFWVLTVAITATVVPLLLAWLLMTIESRAARNDLRQFPQPGETVIVNGRDMHLYCDGENPDAPTVVLEAGAMGWSVFWREVQNQLAETVRVCSYDRAGFGWSERARGVRDAQTIADELHELLDRADEEPPYVLVGHSAGGLFARVFTASYPDDVVGLVLTDPAHEDDETIMTDEMLQAQASVGGWLDTFGTAARFGLIRRVGAANMAENVPFIANPGQVSSLVEAAYYRYMARRSTWQAGRAEYAAIDASEAQARNAVLPDALPLVVIFAEDAAILYGDEVVQGRLALLESLAAQSSNGRLETALTGHDIPLEEPGEVVDAILSIVE